jgi:DNA-binding SARP family transcriptional activator/tetratricopeptide (TPR) repeat protein
MSAGRREVRRNPTRVLVVAAAGYGKTTFTEADLPDDGLRLTLAQARALDAPVSAPLVLEDLHQLPVVERAELLDKVTTLATDIPVTITSREPLDPTSRGMLRGQVFDRGPEDLVLSPHAIGRVLVEEYGVTDPEAPTRIHALTAGWPALVHFAADALSRKAFDDLAGALSRPGSSAAAWIETEVLAPLRPGAVTLLASLAQLDPVSQDLVDEVFGESGTQPDSGTFELLRRIGLLVPHPRLALLGREGHSVVPLLAYALNRLRPASLSARHWTRAAGWYEQHDFAFAAAKAYSRAGEAGRAEDLVVSRGPEMIEQGDAAHVVALVRGSDTIPMGVRVRRTYAEALHMSGDSYAAIRAYAPLAEQADREGWDAGLSYRVATAHYSQNALAEASEVLDRVDVGALTSDADGVLWRAWRANLSSMLGDDERARSLAGQALALAEASGDTRSLVAAYQAGAKTSSGSRKEAHLSMALQAAKQVGDVVSTARILINQSFVLLRSARYTEAAQVARDAVRATEVARPTGALIAALRNLGEALTHVGEYTEARWHLERAVSLSRRMGPNRTAAGLCGLGDLHRALGNQEQGKAAYEEAADLSRASNELQVLVPALAGLARLLSDTSLDEASAAAEEAHRLAPRSLEAMALTALGWVALARRERNLAAELAERAVAAARANQAHDLLAEALELIAEAADPPDTPRSALQEALSIWKHGGAEPAASRIFVLIGRLQDADSSARSRAREAAQQLQRLGVSGVNGRPFGHDVSAKAVAINVLGGFQVVVDGQPVALTAWRSRQARTLVKILAGRRGRPTTRAHLCELLWPDDDPAKTGHRLSVLLATVRGVLDPGRAWPTEHYVESDLTGIWLDLSHITLDAESLLTDAAHASALLSSGETERAREILTDIDARYGGDAFEDEPYELWAEGLREETRAAWLRSLRHLATLATREGRTSDVCTILVRLLGADPYDERVHRGLVKALVQSGRHGEARRAFDNWREAMTAVDAPGPDEAVLTPVELRRPSARVAVLTPR